METSIELPPNFQEEMMNCELEFQEGINEDIIRKLMYIYTLGMQYYNINEKAGYEKYYRNKLNNLLLNDNVITYLDTHQVDLSKRVELNLFEKKEEKTKSKNEGTTEKIHKSTDIEVINLDTKEETQTITEQLPKKVKIDANNLEKKEGFKNKSNLLRSKTIKANKKKDKINREDIMEYVTRKIKEVDIRLVSIDKQVSNNIVEQMSSFESNKRNKKVKQSQNSEKKEEKVSENTINDNNDNNIIVKKDSSNQDSIDLEMAKMQNKNLKRRGSSIGQTKLLKEIEEYVEQNMKEMYKAIEELKQSYAGEIKEAVDSGFDEIAESLRNDLKFEEENLTAQYEEERMKQIELIREKNKKN